MLNADDKPVPHGILVGVGAAVSGTRLNFEQGTIDETHSPLDMMIEGQGLFQVRTIYNGEEIIAYTRAGNFTKNADGDLVLGNSEGALLEPNITLPF